MDRLLFVLCDLLRPWILVSKCLAEKTLQELREEEPKKKSRKKKTNFPFPRD